MLIVERKGQKNVININTEKKEGKKIILRIYRIKIVFFSANLYILPFSFLIK